MDTEDWCERDSLFVFGSLMDPEVLELVSGIAPSELQVTAAWAQGCHQGEVQEESYPVLVPCESARASGMLIKSLTCLALQRILFFEGEEYRLQQIDVFSETGDAVPAYYFSDTGAYTVRDTMWDFEHWQRVHKESFIEASREYMALFGSMSVAEADAHWNELMQERGEVPNGSPPSRG